MKISVIVPVYNVEQYLDKCLTSLVNQTYKNLEIIVVNDGTKDDSQKIIDKYSKKYPDLIKSYIKENGGLSDARNYGITKATGDYLGFVDSDDYIDITMYEKLHNKAITNNFDIVLCDLYSVTDKNTYVSSNLTNDLLNKKEIKKIFNTIYPVAWNKIYKKKLFNDIKYKKGVWFEDVELLYRMLPSVNSIGVVKEPLYYYIQREGAITSKVNSKIYDYIDNFNGIIDFYKKNNLYTKYQTELEYSYVRYIYATFMKRCLAFNYDDYLKALNTAVDNVKTNFPNYRKNKYFYSSLKGLYLVMFSKKLGKLMYKFK